MGFSVICLLLLVFVVKLAIFFRDLAIVLVLFALLVDQPQENFIILSGKFSFNVAMHLQISRPVTGQLASERHLAPKLNSIQLSLRHCNYSHKCCLNCTQRSTCNN